MNMVTVHEISTSETRLEYVMIEGEPYAHGLASLGGLGFALAMNDRAIVFIGKGRRSKSFIRVAFLAEIFPDKQAGLIELRRRLLISHAKCEADPSGDVEVDFTRAG